MRNQILLALGALVAKDSAVEALETATISSSPAEDASFDAPIKVVAKDGKELHSRSAMLESALRNMEERRSQINADGEQRHVLRATPETIDVPMSLEYDFNHVIEMRMRHANDTLNVIPDTHLNHFMLSHPNCEQCYVQHGTKWAPDSNKPLKDKVYSGTFDYFYMMHAGEATLEGRVWGADICFNTEDHACGKDFEVFSIQKADPWFYSLGDGYLGLSPKALDSMTRIGLISKPLLGVHTQMTNSTEDPSQIRFGGYREDLVAEGSSQIWLQTLNETSWELEMEKVSYHGDSLATDSQAIINPGFPFIGVPKETFDAFKEDVTKAYPDEAITCDHIDWCYFIQTCDKITDDMPDLSFTFKGTDGESQTINVPPKSLLVEIVDPQTNLPQCHLAVIGQIYSSSKNWILGQSFMENFYVTFDSTSPEQPKVGISYSQSVVAPSESSSGLSGLWITLIIMGVVALLLVAAFFGFRFLYKRQQSQKLEKAKTYFESLQTKTADDDKAEAETDDSQKEVEVEDPNSFC